MSVSLDLNPTLLAQIEVLAASKADADARVAAAYDLSLRTPKSWSKYGWRFDDNPTLAAFPGLEYDPSVPGLVIFEEQGVKCLRGTVSNTQKPVSSGIRAEAKWTRPEAIVRPGSRSRIRTDFRFDVAGGKWFNSPEWFLFLQNHSFLGGGSPPVSAEIHGDEIRLRVMPDYQDQRKRFTGGVLWTGSVTALANAWHTIELQAQWGLDDNAAWVEMDLDGARVVPRTFGRNMLFDVQALDTGSVPAVDASHGYVGDASPGYWKLGPYQSPKVVGTRSVEYRHMELDVLTPAY